MTDQVEAPQLMLTADQVGQLLNVSRRTVWRMDEEGKLPEPRRLGKRNTRWGAAELAAWVDAGCPSRHLWGPRWAQRNGRAKARP